MSEIKVNMENLKENEREQLLALIEKANKKSKVFKPEVGNGYWYVTGQGAVQASIWQNDPFDKWRNDLNNCFKTKEEGKFKVEKCKVIAELETFALENNDEINWENDCQLKYFLYYDYRKGTLAVSYQTYCSNQGIIHFSSEELCKQAIEKIGEDRIKKYLFKVEEV